MIQSLITFL